MKESIRLFIADDHPPLRAGLASMFQSDPDFTVIGDAGSGRETLEALDKVRADVIIMDLRMPDGDGLQTLRALRKREPGVKVLILTTYDCEEDIFHSLESGARGYLLKDATREEMLEAVRRIHEGQRCLPPAIAARLAERLTRPGLSPREMDVLRLMAKGRSNKEIATAMFVSEETVKSHLKSLFQKLSVHDRVEATAVALQRGLIRI